MPRVLVVDDDPQACDLLCEFLSAKAYEVSAAATGGEGLKRLREERPHLVLLDINLPDMSGLEVLREAKAIDPAVGVIMVTGLQEEEIGRQAMRDGAFDYITKPLDLQYLEKSLWYKITTMTL
ncbi:MAG TPA: response regulator [Candidatus Sulfotelmatobacter sp.]|nr:response regulator [Candidatus Sulfotelmatobacter sp.]